MMLIKVRENVAGTLSSTAGVCTLLASVALFTFATSAQAQSAASSAEASADIIVTATKREQRLLDVPAPLTAISSGDLSRIGANKLADITSRVPGLNLTSDRPGETVIILRGITTGSQISTTVSTYIDETAYGSSTSQALAGVLSPDLDPSDLERVEVLKGPQGTLYGANSLGGLVKYVTTQPDLHAFKGRVELDGSDVAHGGEGFGVRGMINLPLVKDSLAIRASAYYRRDPGFIDNPTLDRTDVDKANVSGGRAALRWRPDDRFTADLTATLQNLKGFGYSDEDVTVVGKDLVPTAGRFDQVRFTAEPLKVRYRLYSAKLDYDFDFARLVSITSYSTMHQRATTDQTTPQAGTLAALFGPGIGFSVGSDLNLKKTTQEARIESAPGSALEWRVGFYYDHEKTARLEPSSTFIVATQTPLPLPGVGTLFFANLFSSYTEYAGFGDLTYHISPRFDLSAGVRYSGNNQNFSETSGGLAVGGTSTVVGSSSDHSTTFQVSSKFKIDANTMVYARIASGYRPGGPNSVTAATAALGVPLQYQPDTLTNYDIGYKAALFDRKITLDLSLFYIAWRHIQLTTLFNGISSAGNGGSARSTGAEAAITWTPTKGLLFSGNAAYTSAKLTEDAPGVNGKDGDRLPNAPKWAANISADYDFPLSDRLNAFAGGTVHYVGDRQPRFVSGSPATYVRPPLPAYTTLDLRTGLTYRGYSLELFVKNVSGTVGFNNVGSNAGNGYSAPLTASIIQPRTIGLSLIANF